MPLKLIIGSGGCAMPDLDKRISVFEKYKEMIFLGTFGIIGAMGGILYSNITTKLASIEEKVYRIDMNTSDLILRVNRLEENEKEFKRSDAEMVKRITLVEQEVIVLKHRRD